MKNLLLILAITFVGSVDADAPKKTYVLEVLETPIKFVTNTVICIQDTVFIQTNTGNIVQLYKRVGTLAVPMWCREYVKTG